MGGGLFCFSSLLSLAFIQALLAFPPAHGAGLVLNEILYDPSGSDDGLEFVELYNPTDAPVSLKGMALETGNGARESDWTVALEWGVEYLVLPGTFVLVGESNVNPTPDFVAELDLQNGPDACRLRAGSMIVDLVGWGVHTFREYYEGRPCEDVASGTSIARLPDGVDSQDNSSDFRPLPAPSPGGRNLRVVDARLVPGSMRTVPALPDAFEPTEVIVDVENCGARTLRPVECAVHFFKTTEAGREFVALRPSPSIEPGQTLPVSVSWQLESEACVFLEAAVVTEGDENPANDTASVALRAGRGLLTVNEIMYAPPAGASEWIELLNDSGFAVDVRGWWIEDSARKKSVITSSSLVLEPGEYLLVAQDKEQLLAAAGGVCDGRLLEPEGAWPSLNNHDQAGRGYADVVCVRDSAGCISDYVAYSDEWLTRANSSLERVSAGVPSRLPSNWTSSVAAQGSTPCQANSTAEVSPGTRAGEIALSSRVISPDGDGVDDRVVLSFSLPSQGYRADLSVFDSEGRLVRKLLDQRRVGTVVQAVWDGTDDRSRPVPPALYIVHLATLGPRGETGSAKTTLAVAPRRRR